MLEAQARGHRLLYVDPADLGVDDDARARARARRSRCAASAAATAELGEPRTVASTTTSTSSFQRKDPPVDAEYVIATQILSLCRRALVLNRPEGILAANEKLYALHFPDLMPETRRHARASPSCAIPRRSSAAR